MRKKISLLIYRAILTFRYLIYFCQYLLNCYTYKAKNCRRIVTPIDPKITVTPIELKLPNCNTYRAKNCKTVSLILPKILHL